MGRDVFADADLVIEAVFEEMSVKQQVFAEVEAVVSAECVLATDTSALSVSEVASKLEHPERVVGPHFFNPVAVLSLLDVVRADQTDDATRVTAFAVGRQLKKSWVLVADAPAFVVNRLLTRRLAGAGHRPVHDPRRRVAVLAGRDLCPPRPRGRLREDDRLSVPAGGRGLAAGLRALTHGGPDPARGPGRSSSWLTLWSPSSRHSASLAATTRARTCAGYLNLRVRLSIVRSTEAIVTCEIPLVAPAASIASCAARSVAHTASASPSSVVPRAPTSYRSPEAWITAPSGGSP